MKRLKTTRLVMLVSVFMPLTSVVVSPLAFNFSCANIDGVNSDGKGDVWTGGSKAAVKAFNENYWEAKNRNNTVSISRRDDGNPDVSWNGPNRKHGICLPEGNIDFSGAKKSASTGLSFSCAAATGDSIEESICQNPSFPETDLALSGAYKQTLAKSSDSPTLGAGQRGWVKGRNECWEEQGKSACIARNYSERMAELRSKRGVK